MDDYLRELYQEMILDHGKHPRHFHKLEPCTHMAKGHNPSCGDHLDLFVNIEKDHLQKLSFQGDGCAISIASASLMTDLLPNIPLKTLPLLFDYFHNLCTQENEDPALKAKLIETHHVPEAILEKLAILRGVQQFPMRVKCATLAWHTLMAAIDNKKKISTE